MTPAGDGDGGAGGGRGATLTERSVRVGYLGPAGTWCHQALLDAGVPADKIGTFTLFEPAGCRDCNDRGYRGRVALYEVMPFWDGLKELVINGASAAELKQEAIRLGMQTLRMAGLQKMMAGMTSISEVVGNTAQDRF